MSARDPHPTENVRVDLPPGSIQPGKPGEGLPPHEPPSVFESLVGNTNAQYWAEALKGRMRQAEQPLEVDDLLPWFATAIEAGREAGHRQEVHAMAERARLFEPGEVIPMGDPLPSAHKPPICWVLEVLVKLHGQRPYRKAPIEQVILQLVESWRESAGGKT